MSRDMIIEVKMMKIQWMTRNALIATIYVVLTLTPPLNTLSFYAIQFRISEALLIFVWFRKEYAVGILIGTFFANMFGPLGAGFAFLDAVFGTLMTFISLFMMMNIRSKQLGLLTPIVFNGIYLSLFLPFALSLPYTFDIIITTFATVSLGEAVVVYGLGLPLTWLIEKQPSLKKLVQGQVHG